VIQPQPEETQAGIDVSLGLSNREEVRNGEVVQKPHCGGQGRSAGCLVLARLSAPFRRRKSPQHVCIGLFDALPQHVLQRWREELKHLPEKDGQLEWRKRIQDFLDSGYGSCFLRDDRLAEIVQNALMHFDGERYALHGWCVMPNHVHVLFTPEEGFKMSGIVHSWKSFTANQCNRLLGRTGSFWQKEPFDRWIRNERHYQNALGYIEDNPVKAGLCKTRQDWLWSSARRR
jgi:REP element-mobilizing transposase RayT